MLDSSCLLPPRIKVVSPAERKGSEERKQLLRTITIGEMQPHAAEVGQGLDTRRQRERLRKALLS